MNEVTHCKCGVLVEDCGQCPVNPEPAAPVDVKRERRVFEAQPQFRNLTETLHRELIFEGWLARAAQDQQDAERLRLAIRDSGNSIVQARRSLLEDCPMPTIAAALSYMDEALELMGEALAGLKGTDTGGS